MHCATVDPSLSAPSKTLNEKDTWAQNRSSSSVLCCEERERFSLSFLQHFTLSFNHLQTQSLSKMCSRAETSCLERGGELELRELAVTEGGPSVTASSPLLEDPWEGIWKNKKQSCICSSTCTTADLNSPWIPAGVSSSTLLAAADLLKTSFHHRQTTWCDVWFCL